MGVFVLGRAYYEFDLDGKQGLRLGNMEAVDFSQYFYSFLIHRVVVVDYRMSQ